MKKNLNIITFLFVITSCLATCIFYTNPKYVKAKSTEAIATAEQNNATISTQNSQKTIAGEKNRHSFPASEYKISDEAKTSIPKPDTSLPFRMAPKSKTNSTSGTYGNIHWDISGTTLTITGTGAIPDSSTDSEAPWSNANVSTVIISQGITSIGNENFMSMDTITSVSIPSTLKSIGEAAFYECSQITEIILPSSVERIGDGAFADCISLTSFSAEGAAYLGDYILQNTKLTTFEIPKKITEFSTLAFYGTTTLKNYYVASGNTTFLAEDGIVYNKDKSTLILYPCNKTDTNFKIPSSVTKIEDYAFYNTQNLLSVDFSNVKQLGEGAFYCSSLSGSLKLSDKITEVGYFTFESCPNINSVTFGTGLVESSYSMFEECTGITSINFGGLKKIGMRTFLGCSGLKEVVLPDTITEWGGSSFNSCENLETFISNGLKEISYADFAQCYSLKTVKLSSVEKIYREAFANCPSLKNITLPKSTQWVDANAFSDDVNVSCLNTELVKFGRNGLHYAESITISGKRDYTQAFKVLSIVNQKRRENNLPELTMDTGLLEAAMLRAGEQAVLFSHTRPDETSCFTAHPNMIAENIAIGQTTAYDVMDSWMHSTGHRENILLEDATSIGIGCFYINGVHMWVQCFGANTANNATMKTGEQSVTQTISIPKDTFSEAATTSGIIWGESASYTYMLNIPVNKTNYKVGDKTRVGLQLINPGYDYLHIDFTSRNISWTSSNPSIARIDQNGNISFVGAGKVTITGKTKYHQAAVTFTVSKNTGSNSVSAKVDQSVKPLLNTKKDKDPAKSKYSILRLHSGNVSKNSIELRWRKVKNASTYVIIGNKCGSGYKKITTLKKTNYKVKKFNKKALKKGTYYKFFVAAFDKNGKQLSVSKTIHVTTSGGKYGNIKKLILKKSKITLRKNKSYKINVKAQSQSKKLKNKKHKNISFESTNPKIATVANNGKVKAKKKGTCTIFVYGQNGVSKTIKIYVKP